jgi:hypothetical protein
MNTITTKLPLEVAKKRLESAKSSLESSNEKREENTRRRMENYFNCVDDYSWGGLCDQASADERRREENLVNLLANQVDNNGVAIKEFVRFGIKNGKGEVVDFEAKDGKYGKFFVDGDTFVGVAKKLSTYQKKGYELVKIKFTVKSVVENKISKKGNPIQEVVECTAEVLPIEGNSIKDEVVYSGIPYPLWLARENKKITWL